MKTKPINEEWLDWYRNVLCDNKDQPDPEMTAKQVMITHLAFLAGACAMMKVVAAAAEASPGPDPSLIRGIYEDLGREIDKVKLAGAIIIDPKDIHYRDISRGRHRN